MAAVASESVFIAAHNWQASQNGLVVLAAIKSAGVVTNAWAQQLFQ